MYASSFACFFFRKENGRWESGSCEVVFVFVSRTGGGPNCIYIFQRHVSKCGFFFFFWCDRVGAKWEHVEREKMELWEWVGEKF